MSWLGCASSDRVAGKVLKSLAGLVERDGASDTNLAMGLQIAGPLMALVRGAGSTNLRAVSDLDFSFGVFHRFSEGALEVISSLVDSFVGFDRGMNPWVGRAA